MMRSVVFLTVSSAAGTHNEIAAAGPPTAGTRGRWLKLEWGFLLWFNKVRKAPSSGSAGNTGGREAPEAATAESSAAERSSEFLRNQTAIILACCWKWQMKRYRLRVMYSPCFISPSPALWYVNGELIHGRTVGGGCWHVGWAWWNGG